jgi:hypothetical protein
MKKIHESHQAHFFADNTDVQVNPIIMTSLIQGLAKFNLYPTIGQVINALNGSRTQFVTMVNSDESLRVELAPDRLVIAREGGEINSFVTLASEISRSLHALFPSKTGSRIALVSARVYEGKISEYDDLYRKLFTYKSIKPFEWDNRIAEKKNAIGETINSISTIRRCRVQTSSINSGNKTDAILSEIDLNTLPENQSSRFSLEKFPEMINGLYIESAKSSQLLSRYFD